MVAGKTHKIEFHVKYYVVRPLGLKANHVMFLHQLRVLNENGVLTYFITENAFFCRQDVVS